MLLLLVGFARTTAHFDATLELYILWVYYLGFDVDVFGWSCEEPNVAINIYMFCWHYFSDTIRCEERGVFEVDVCLRLLSMRGVNAQKKTLPAFHEIRHFPRIWRVSRCLPFLATPHIVVSSHENYHGTLTRVSLLWESRDSSNASIVKVTLSWEYYETSMRLSDFFFSWESHESLIQFPW